jgi:hypothetical protein
MPGIWSSPEEKAKTIAKNPARTATDKTAFLAEGLAGFNAGQAPAVRIPFLGRKRNLRLRG